MNLKKIQNRPKWSLKTSFWGGVVIVLLVSLVTAITLRKSIWIELEIIVGILSFFMFSFLFYILYHGIRFDSDEKYTITFKKIDFDRVINPSSILDTSGELNGMGADAGILGIIIGFLLDIIISVILSFLIALLFWVGLNIVITAIIILFLPLFYIFRRSLRYVVAKGRRCNKDIKKSFFFSLRATVLNTFWLYVIILSGHYIAKIAMKSG